LVTQGPGPYGCFRRSADPREELPPEPCRPRTRGGVSEAFPDSPTLRRGADFPEGSRFPLGWRWAEWGSIGQSRARSRARSPHEMVPEGLGDHAWVSPARWLARTVPHDEREDPRINAFSGHRWRSYLLAVAWTALVVLALRLWPCGGG